MAAAWSSRCPSIYENDPCPKLNEDLDFGQNLAQFVVNSGSSLRTLDELVRIWLEKYVILVSKMKPISFYLASRIFVYIYSCNFKTIGDN